MKKFFLAVVLVTVAMSLFVSCGNGQKYPVKYVATEESLEAIVDAYYHSYADYQLKNANTFAAYGYDIYELFDDNEVKQYIREHVASVDYKELYSVTLLDKKTISFASSESYTYSIDKNNRITVNLTSDGKTIGSLAEDRSILTLTYPVFEYPTMLIPSKYPDQISIYVPISQFTLQLFKAE